MSCARSGTGSTTSPTIGSPPWPCPPTPARPALAAFAQQEGFDFPLLADFWPHGEVARSYGVFHEAVGAAERGTFVIDLDGVVRYAVHNGLGDARDDQAYLDALRAIGAA